MDIIQLAFEIGELVLDCTWNNVILISKDRGDYRGIGLVGVPWKLFSIIVDRRLAESIEFHDFLHMFIVWRGNATTTLEEKIFQEIMGMQKEVLCEIFVDINKVNDALERGRAL